ncbi:hypothetical protein RRG08_062644 [Elysia crispata]|uniref:Uncharacterized protein n=1 Tax=Elysia crispata TaxID=231223 RepID=A0AAE1D6U9_9GAST|nr:hypothetical protein RRG08_062644 [Elysia crispata]
MFTASSRPRLHTAKSGWRVRGQWRTSTGLRVAFGKGWKKGPSVEGDNGQSWLSNGWTVVYDALSVTWREHNLDTWCLQHKNQSVSRIDHREISI